MTNFFDFGCLFPFNTVGKISPLQLIAGRHRLLLVWFRLKGVTYSHSLIHFNSHASLIYYTARGSGGQVDLRPIIYDKVKSDSSNLVSSMQHAACPPPKKFGNNLSPLGPPPRFPFFGRGDPFPNNPNFSENSYLFSKIF